VSTVADGKESCLSRASAHRPPGANLLGGGGLGNRFGRWRLGDIAELAGKRVGEVLAAGDTELAPRSAGWAWPPVFFKSPCPDLATRPAASCFRIAVRAALVDLEQGGSVAYRRADADDGRQSYPRVDGPMLLAANATVYGPALRRSMARWELRHTRSGRQAWRCTQVTLGGWRDQKRSQTKRRSQHGSDSQPRDRRQPVKGATIFRSRTSSDPTPRDR